MIYRLLQVCGVFESACARVKITAAVTHRIYEQYFTVVVMMLLKEQFSIHILHSRFLLFSPLSIADTAEHNIKEFIAKDHFCDWTQNVIKRKSMEESNYHHQLINIVIINTAVVEKKHHHCQFEWQF